MNPIELTKASKRLTNYLRHDFPRKVGKIGEDYFKESFQNEGFTDKVFVRWEEVQRRKPEHQRLIRKRGNTRRSQKFSKAERTRKILSGPDDSGLGDSIRWEADYNAVTFQTDVPYAQAHNEGTTNAGRGRTTKIPQRQFMGESEVLRDKVRKELTNTVNKLFKH